MAGLEGLIADVLQRLQGSTEEELQEAAKVLGRSVEDVTKATKKGRTGLLRFLQRHLLSEEVEDSPDQGKALWESLAEALGVGVKVGVPKGNDCSETTPPEEKEASLDNAASFDEPDIKPQLVSWKREFKLTGQIGEPGQKDKLTFSSVARQIEAGLRKGYPEDEVVEAVIRSISPGHRLRSYLEGRQHLRLDTLRRIIRSHYREKDATSLFHELSIASQSPKENAHDFVLRTLDLKQKVIFASKEAGSGVIYERDQVQRMFLRSVATGLQSDTLRNILRPHLEDVNCTDEGLLEVLTSAVGQETERLQKLRSRQGRTEVLSASADVPPMDQPISSAASKEKEKKVTTTKEMPGWSEMQAAIRSIIQEEMKSNQKAPQSNPPPSKRRMGCPRCKAEGQGDMCTHCFKCGSSEHYARGCRMRGNDRRVPQWDMGHPNQGRPNDQ